MTPNPLDLLRDCRKFIGEEPYTDEGVRLLSRIDLALGREWAVVPREPTEEMVRAAMEYQRGEGKAWTFKGTFRAMLEAAEGEGK